MQRFRMVPVLLPVLLHVGCAEPRQNGSSPGARNAGANASGADVGAKPASIAVDPGSPHGASASKSAAHVFTPRPHPPHRPIVAHPVRLDSLPPLRTALDSCFGAERDTVLRPLPPSPAPPPRPRRAPTYGGADPSSEGAVVGGVVGGVAPSAPAPAPSAAAPSGLGRGAGGAAPPSAQSSAAPSAQSSAGRREAVAAPEHRAEAKRAPSDAAKAKESVARGRAERDDRAVAEQAPEPAVPPSGYYDWGAAVYLSNDDSMSLSSAQRVIYAIDRFLPISPSHVRPHELLNYFSFDTAPLAPESAFSVLAELQPKPGEAGIYTLALSVAGRDPSREERRHGALTFVVDRSGSMHAEGRMDYLKRGLRRMTEELKPGDIVNLVLFDDRVCAPLENFVVGRDRMDLLERTIARIAPRGSTNLHAGLERGYALANASYQTTHSNRVVLITDALANAGETDPDAMALIAENYDRRRIRLSAVGVGTEFNDALLDGLTERGRGAYVFLGSGAEVDAVFGHRFTSLIETVANDVHFRLHLPPSLAMNVFYGEESSVHKEDVLPIHYFAGTSQLFLSDLRARDGELRLEDGIMLSVEYENAETDAAEVEEFAFRLGDINGTFRNIPKARLVMSFIDGVADTLKSAPLRVAHRAGGWEDDHAWQQCERGRESLAQQARAVSEDREVARVVRLWDKYCSRYQPRERVRQPVRREPPRGGDVWPSAE